MSHLVITGLLIAVCLGFTRRWRLGVFGIVCWDVFRDPLRKLVPEYLVFFAITGAAFWLACLVGCLRDSETPAVSDLIPRPLRIPFSLFAGFLLFGVGSAWVSGMPWQGIALGIGSYTFPVVGFAVGRQFGCINEQRRLATFFCLLNVPAIGTAALELAEIRSPVLGGIMMEWYRFRGTHSIPLPCGIFRSPDILGLHAAHVFIFGALLALTADSRRLRVASMLAFAWGGVFLLISARRKMVGLASLFVISLGVLQWTAHRLRVRSGERSSFIGIAFLTHRKPVAKLVGLIGLGCSLILFWNFARPQIVYAFSVLQEGPYRLFVTLIDAPLTTVRQSGFWGVGIGAATQGLSQISPAFPGAWQEDGFSRLILEAGVIGAVAIVAASLLGAAATIKRISGEARSMTTVGQWRQGLVSLLIGNAGCFLVSHQHLSGDPVWSGLLGFWLGCLWRPQNWNGVT